MPMFEPSVLRDENALQDALNILDHRFQSPTTVLDDMVRDLMERSKLFEFVFSCAFFHVYHVCCLISRTAIGESAAARVIQNVLDGFPRNAEHFQTSLASTLLATLSLYFWSLEYPYPGLRECHHAVDLARPALRTLGTMTFQVQPDARDADADSPEEEFFVKKRVRQKDRKKAKLAARSPTVDLRPFSNLGIDPPTNKFEALTLAEALLADQKSTLKVSTLVLTSHILIDIR